MGCRNNGLTDTETWSSSFSEPLLFATMFIIGLPVEVHIKDGSVYSGIFHTACVEHDYGVVLKKARMTRKGKMHENAANEGLIETLVIVSDDLVQVVAKGVQLPASGVSSNMAGDDAQATGTVQSSEPPVINAENSVESAMDLKHITQTRNSAENENGSFASQCAGKNHEGVELAANGIRSSVEVMHPKRDGIDLTKFEETSAASVIVRQSGDNWSQGKKETCKQSEFHGENTSSCAVSSGVSSSLSPAGDVTSESCHRPLAASTGKAPPHGSESNRSAKEFKLNPGAKVFSPSSRNSTLATSAVPTVGSRAYIPNNSPVVPVGISHPEVGLSTFASRASVPAKFMPYASLTAGNGGSGSQFSQPIAGHVGSRGQPLRYTGQYPVQAGPAYVPPNSEAVAVGRVGQLVYVHPVTHDLVHSAAAVPPLSACPLLAQQQAHLPKHQGGATGQALQLCVPLPLMASGHQPVAVPSYTPVLQPPF